MRNDSLMTARLRAFTRQQDRI